MYCMNIRKKRVQIINMKCARSFIYWYLLLYEENVVAEKEIEKYIMIKNIVLNSYFRLFYLKLLFFKI